MRTTWKQRVFNQKDGTRKITDPDKNGDYWITDGYYVHLGHFHRGTSGGDWGIYQPDQYGLLRHCYNLDDMNFDIVAWCKPDFPKIPIKYREL